MRLDINLLRGGLANPQRVTKYMMFAAGNPPITGATQNLG